jgi:serine/threonine protein kinase
MLDGLEPKIMDFGLAKIEGSHHLSQEGMLLGTLYYMAPEQADGRLEDVDGQSDIFSLGMMLYEMIAGKLPYKGNTFGKIIDEIIHGSIIPLYKIKPGTPKALSEICQKATAKEKKNRYQNAAEMADDLQRFISGSYIFSSSKKKNIGIAFGAIAAFIALSNIWPFYTPSNKNIPNQTDKKQKTNTIADHLPKLSSKQEVNSIVVEEKAVSPKEIPSKINKPEEKEITRKSGNLFSLEVRPLEKWKITEGNIQWKPDEEKLGVYFQGTGSIQCPIPYVPIVLEGKISPIHNNNKEASITFLSPREIIQVRIQFLSPGYYFLSIHRNNLLHQEKEKIDAFALATGDALHYQFTLSDNNIEGLFLDKNINISLKARPLDVGLAVVKSSGIYFQEIRFYPTKN